MKKIIAFLLVAALLCVSVPFSASAADAPTVTVGSASGVAGDTVSVPVVISGNPGIVSMYLSLEYDTTRLSLVSVTEGALLSDPLHSESVTDVPYHMSWDDGAALENVTANGTLVTLNFKILDAAPLGDAAITLSKDAGGIFNAGLAPVAFDFVAGKVTVEEPVPVSKIVAADVMIGTDITVNYFATLDPAHAGAQMRFTLGDLRPVVVDGTPAANGEYVYAFRGVAPQTLGDNIKAELILGDEVLAVRDTYSVKTYCTRMLSKTAAQLGLSDEKYAALRTLIIDLLEYGAAAQVYRDHNVDALVNEGITGASTFEPLTKTDKYVTASGHADVKLTTLGVYFDYVNALYVDFLAPGMTESTCYIKVTNKTAGGSKIYYLSDCTLRSSNQYNLIMDPIFATDFDDVYSIELYAPNESGTVVAQQYVEYSIASYVYSMQNKTTDGVNLTAMAKLARATYNYGIAASEYAAA
ncbi:MAG: hypothetical protein E7637_05800 [Ruminococcaceae bacterium]|nr:hypothetical protein [Oscillospiraceae bacterium]